MVTTTASSSVNTACKAYTDALPMMQKVRAFVASEVKAYVRRLRGHDDKDYELYKDGAYFLPAVARTLDAYAGLVMTPEPIVSDAPTSFQPFLDDLTNEGEPFQRVAYRAVEEVSATGRYCILVDYPNAEGAESKTVKEVEDEGLRPFARCYRWEDIIDWRTTVVNGRRILSHLRLRETVEEAGATEWVTKTRRYVRVLDLHEGHYRVRVFKENQQIDSTVSHDGQSGNFSQDGGDIYPMIGGERLKEIPAVIFGPNSLDPASLVMPPLKEMCDVSQSHLNDSALRQWALMWCGNPTLVISGLMDSESDEPIKFGSSQAIVLGEGGAANLVSLGAEGVGALKDSMEEKRRDMAAIGARILADENGAQISTETARIQRAGEHSVLAGISNTVADGMTMVLRWVAQWAGIDAPKLAVTLNTDFLPSGLQPGELTEWFKAYQDGAMPLSVLLERLKSRGVVDPQMSEQDWNDQIDAGLVKPPEDDGDEEDDEGEDDDPPEDE